MIIVNNHSEQGAKNSLIANIITFGEGNHKDHHDNPRSHEDSALLKPLIKILENA
jgi:fatty-acid desaturase